MWKNGSNDLKFFLPFCPDLKDFMVIVWEFFGEK